jgi:hypothetical protein
MLVRPSSFDSAQDDKAAQDDSAAQDDKAAQGDNAVSICREPA